MKHKIFTCLVAVCAAFLIRCPCEPNELIGSVAVTLMPQETNNWCWAATTQMITSFLGHGRTQCDLANERFGRTDCCTGNCPKTDSCNRPGWTMFGACGFTTAATATPLSWDAIQEEIFCDEKPLSYAYGPMGGGVGHVVVVSGYVVIDGIQFLSITDPWAPCTGQNRFLAYTTYSGANHWETNSNITYSP